MPLPMALDLHEMSRMGDMGDMGDMGNMGGDNGGMSHDHGGMSMSGGGCNLSMLGNWNTIHSCFLASSWSINTHAQFAGTCIGVACWVILTECVRRWAREFDRAIIAKAIQNIHEHDASPTETWVEENYVADMQADTKPSRMNQETRIAFPMSWATTVLQSPPAATLSARDYRVRPTLWQQVIRALLYAIQFTSAYLLMLIAMSYNGYVLISMMLGALIGYFAASWDTLGTINPSAIQRRKSLKPYAVKNDVAENHQNDGVCMNMI